MKKILSFLPAFLATSLLFAQTDNYKTAIAVFQADYNSEKAEDLVQFANAQFNPGNRELALTRKPTFTVNPGMKTGLGWHILKFGNEKEIFWHNGGTGGYSSSMLIHPETKTAVIILSNVSAFHPRMKNIDNLSLALMQHISKE